MDRCNAHHYLYVSLTMSYTCCSVLFLFLCCLGAAQYLEAPQGCWELHDFKYC